MRVVIIGGSGHVGTYLVPRLVQAGHEVLNLSRGQREPYQPHAAWRSVQQIAIDRAAEEKTGSFGQRVQDLQADVVIDMIGAPGSRLDRVVAIKAMPARHNTRCL